jgi:hypothetical protein
MKTIEKIRQLIRENMIIPVVGAGVSHATAGLPGWFGLVKDGLQYVKEKQLDYENLIEVAQNFLDQNRLTDAATIVKKLLNAPDHPFSDWLTDLLGKPAVHSTELIESIQNLCLPIIATTNYDDLLNEVGLNQNTNIYDWSEFEEIQRALLDGQKCIFHLHGRYRKPNTTIFGADDYYKLTSEIGYKTLLQQLWMNKHFLFIGCSRDGVMDNDFMTVLLFMRKWFPSLPHEHYILMKNSEMLAGNHITLLKDYNVHAVNIGESYDTLPRFINGLNSNEDRLIEYREKIGAKIETGLKNILDAKANLSLLSKVDQYIKDTLGNPYYWIDSSRLRMLEDALNKYNEGILSKKEQFENYQIIIKGLVSVSELEEKVQFWKHNWDNPGALNNPEFIEIAILAFNCLERFPRKLMEDIRHRAPYAVHDYYFENYLGHFIRDYKLFKGLKDLDIKEFYRDDSYFFENLKRIIESLRSVLALDPSVLFATIDTAQPAWKIPFPCLLLRSAESISIREIQPPYKSIAVLPGEKNVKNRFAELITYKGRKLIIGYNSQKCFYWDPEKDIAATEFLEGPIQTAVYKMFNYHNNEHLVTEVFCGEHVYYFQDFVLKKKEKIRGGYHQFVRLLMNHRIFCKAESLFFKERFCLFEYKGEDQFSPILKNLDLFNFIRDISIIKEMLAADLEEEGHSVPEEDFRFPFINDLDIVPAEWKGKDVLIIRFKLELWKNLVTVLMIFDPEENEWIPKSIVILPGKYCFAFDIISHEKGVDMFCAYLGYNGNLIEYIEGIDKKLITIAKNAPGTFPRDYENYSVQDIYNLTIVSTNRILVNEESQYLLDVDIPSMTYERTLLDTDISSMTYYSELK